VLKDNAAITTYMEARFLEPPKKADIQWLGAASPAPLFPHLFATTNESGARDRHKSSI
jgi:hypothetical protein